MQIPPEEERFVKNVQIMAEAIYAGVDKLYKQGHKIIDPSLVLFAAEMIKTYDPHETIQNFIKHSHVECWDKIKARDETFFINNIAIIFQKLPMDTVALFKSLFLTVDENGKSVISEGLKTNIWELFDAMVKISIKYVYKHRLADEQFFKDVDVERHIKVWEVKI